ncbi:SpoIIE family protein phosphatase [Tunturiibacter psychrotolerans]|uniref:PP2C family protein-serine/threonine phosphatase n=1 Tax=Tunturiibacter psychrotolerans TaxID=3069686 RepID=UPI003D1E3B60
MLRAKAACLVLCWLSMVPTGIWAQAPSPQVFAAHDPGTGSVAVDGLWEFHTSDSPVTGEKLAWAQPGYDDSGWERLRGDETWGSQTHPGHTGWAWYRKQIDISGAGSKLAILVPPVDDAYEIFWNGEQIGGYGKVEPPEDWWVYGHEAVYPLSVNGEGNARGTLAIRVWKSALSTIDPGDMGGLNGAPVIGDTTVLTTRIAARMDRSERHHLLTLLMSAVTFVSGIFALLLFIKDRQEKLYLWLSIYLLSAALLGMVFLNIVRYGVYYPVLELATESLNCARDGSLWLILLSLFGFWKDRLWRRWTIGLIVVYLVSQLGDGGMFFFWWDAGPGMQWIDGIFTLIFCFTPLYMLIIVSVGLLRRRVELLPLAFTVFVAGVYAFTDQIRTQGVRFTHSTFLQDHMTRLIMHVGIYVINPQFVIDTLLFVVLVATVGRHQIKERARQEQIEQEVKSAREVQRVLVPETVPAVPGYAIASVYKPAAEVGGDFFQVISQPDGGAVVVLGDVSGKGLKAAMTVSLIVGTIRTLVDYTQSPAEILDGLNRRLRGRMQNGFATCVVLRIQTNGDATVANAGHFAPLRDGVEVSAASGSLPLGLVEDADYEEVTFRVEEGQTLMLYTDGIVEARSATGELFGFDRTQELVQKKSTADEIAATACAFGQDDDITVLSISRLGAHEPAEAALFRFNRQIATA